MRTRKTQANAVQLRNHPTDAERHLWRHLRRRELSGFKFRRQYPCGPYVADFACLDARLIIELDGGQHVEQAGYDERRDRWFGEAGFTVLRFWNDEVLKETDAVLGVIWNKLRSLETTPTLTLPRKRGRESVGDL